MPGKKRQNRIEHAKPSWHADEQIKHIRLLMILVFSLLILVTGVGVWYAYTQIHQLSQGGSEPESSGGEESSTESEEGLPVYPDSFCLKICAPENPLEDEEQPQLVEYGDVELDERIIPALKELLQAAEEAGCPLQITGGYISPQEQDALYQQEVERLVKDKGYSRVMAERQAEKTVPKGGCSEMQTGLSFQVGAAGGEEESFQKTKAYSFLVRNAADYGFVFRYPEGSEVITNHEFDPTCLRYVGVKNAQRMRELSMCLEEYVTYRENGSD